MTESGTSVKIGLLNSRIQSLLNEMELLERRLDTRDVDMCLNTSMNDLLTLSSGVSELNDNSLEDFIESAVCSLRRVIARSIQGRSCSLSELCKTILSDLTKLVDMLTSDGIEGKRRVIVLEMITNLMDEVVLSEEIKYISQRSSYGFRKKSSNVFEDTDRMAIFRWDVNITSHFTDSSLSIIRDGKAHSSRYGKLVTALGRVVEALSKSPPMLASKVAELEERVSKANVELEKYKQKQNELDKKRFIDLNEKNRKEELRKSKLLEREETISMKAEDLLSKQILSYDKQREREMKAKITIEKKSIDNLDKSLNKQKQILMNFLASSVKTSKVDNHSKEVENRSTNRLDVAEFEKSLREELSITDLSRLSKFKLKTRNFNRKRDRKFKSIHVSVPGNLSVFSSSISDKQIDIKEIVVDNKLKLLHFHEDVRPAYYGTYSKRSSKISGRKPFSRDSELINYEYDSECEWEAEAEDGEDIEQSDGGSEDDSNCGNDLVYDEFFLKDNDFGSDADSDGELVAASIMRSQRGETEFIGLSYSRTSSDREYVMTIDKKLLGYKAVVMSPTNLLPLLGDIATPAIISNEVTAADNEKKYFKDWTNDQVCALVKLIHGKKDGMDRVVVSFQSDHPTIPKCHIRKKILEISEKEKHSEGYGSFRWIVKPQFLEPVASEVIVPVYTPPKKKRKIDLSTPKQTLSLASFIKSNDLSTPTVNNNNDGSNHNQLNLQNDLNTPLDRQVTAE